MSRILKNIVSCLMYVHTTSFLATSYSRYVHLIGAKPFTEVEGLAKSSFVELKDDNLSRVFLCLYKACMCHIFSL